MRCQFSKGQITQFYKLHKRVAVRKCSSLCVQPKAQEDVTVLAKKLEEKQAELDKMFVSGGKIPKASEVAALRQELKELRQQLAGEVSIINEDFINQVDPAIQRTVGQVACEKARKVLFELGHQGLQSSELGKPILTVAERTELEALELENAVLRSKANKLLLRQQLLEELILEYESTKGTKMDDVPVVHAEENEELEHALKGELGLEREQDQTAVMQAPSYY
eukprot:TRINITY_DN1703_c0_g1_i1.p4 TRINITY_DN1703_c0_g1~~TRINITY_DN1703_c0_g1_i1.p4  ORF type:complete len:223 (-),score=29.85 TRINITY_DN1703_c0_g1_i1:379-1047(-)